MKIRHLSNGTLDERSEKLEHYLFAEVRTKLFGLADFYGVDALMRVILKWMKLDKRSDTEKLAEIAFGLVPGQISEVFKTKTTRLVIPRLNELVGYQDSGSLSLTPVFGRAEFELRNWEARECFAYDDKTGTLFTYDPTAEEAK